MKREHIKQYTSYHILPPNYIASPLGLTDKSDGRKRRIHHLSYPANTADLVNSGIPEQYGTITYSSISDAVHAIQDSEIRCLLIKRDFESAFRHIPVSPLDPPLLGFHWQSHYYAEQFLPFGLRTAPYLFNLFAETFYWILEDQFQRKGLPAKIIHYLDDFLIIIPPTNTAHLKKYGTIFSELSQEVGLSIKESKNEEGTVASFGGIEIDTVNMVIRLPKRKQWKAQLLVDNAINQTSLSLLDLQKITGYLNFVATVVPLGRTFLRRLYNMQLYIPPLKKNYRRRISREARKNLLWWQRALTTAPERSVKKEARDTIAIWSDAASTKGLGAFYIDNKPNLDSSSPKTQTTAIPQPKPGAAFSIALSRNLVQAKEHINTKEMRAVEQALLHWGSEWRGKKVVFHVDNRAVFHAIENRTIRGLSMDVLRRCLLLAAEYDLEVEAKWIPTKDNALADALFRFDYNRIANLAPQLIYPICSHRNLGYLTYNSRDSHQ